MRAPIPFLVVLLLLSGAAAGLPADYTPPEDPPEYEQLVEKLQDGIGAVEVAPDGTIYFAVLSGPVYELVPGGEPRVVFDPPVVRGPEWGITDVILAPDHEETGALIVVYMTAPEGVDPSRSDAEGETRVVRVVDGEEEALIYSYPARQFHNSGRVLLHDGLLFLTRGDHNERARAKETNEDVGRVLRMTLDGEPAPDNPYGDYTYAYGLRNPFGIAWDHERDVLVLAEVGQDKTEEVNIILPGEYYGWPQCEGPCDVGEEPIVWYPEVITPTGMVVVGGDYYHGSYNHGHLFRVHETEEGWRSEIVLTHESQIIDLERSPDGEWLYLGTFRGLYRVATPEASLEGVEDEPPLVDDEGEENVEPGPARVPGPGAGLVVALAALAARALRRRE